MKNFQALLDRYGSDFDQWPKSEAEAAKRFLLISREARLAHDQLIRLESWIAASRPLVSEASVRRVIDRSTLSICHHEGRLSFVDRLRILLAAPVPRVAFVMALTAIGFGLGIALGAPDIAAGDGPGGPVLTASADDVLF